MKLAHAAHEQTTKGQGLMRRWTLTTVRAVGDAVAFPARTQRADVPTFEHRLDGGWSRLAIA